MHLRLYIFDVKKKMRKYHRRVSRSVRRWKGDASLRCTCGAKKWWGEHSHHFIPLMHVQRCIACTTISFDASSSPEVLVPVHLCTFAPSVPDASTMQRIRVHRALCKGTNKDAFALCIFRNAHAPLHMHQRNEMVGVFSPPLLCTAGASQRCIPFPPAYASRNPSVVLSHLLFYIEDVQPQVHCVPPFH